MRPPIRGPYFIYAPLNDKYEIRLLTIQPGVRESIIEGSLHVVTIGLLRDRFRTRNKRNWLHRAAVRINPTPQYETMSYCWGDPAKRIAIRLDGKEFSITAEAAAALREARRADWSRVIWIDSICINQRDDVERSQQVGLMADIYTFSTGNLIFLGEDQTNMAGRAFFAFNEEGHANPFELLDKEAAAWLYSAKWFR